MKIEQFYGDAPLERLQRELVGREAAIEVLAVDNSPDDMIGSEERYLERYPSREPAAPEVRDFIALHYTPLQMVWNKSEAGLSARPGTGPEHALDPAIRILSLKTTITGLKPVTLPRDKGPELKLVEIENTAGVYLAFPLRHVAQSAEGVLSMAITENTFSRRREYSARLYNTVLVICLPY